MKKILLWLAIGAIALVLAALLVVSLFLDGVVKKGVETVGPKIAKVPVTLDAVKLSILSGSGTIHGLVIGNPEGYKTPHAISVGSATLSIKPASLISDKIVIQTFNVQAPEIIFEGGLNGNNLSQILANVKSTTGGGAETNAPSTPEEQKAASRKLEVDEFVISGAKVTVNLTDLGGRQLTVAIPDIHLSNLGTGPDGITAGALAKEALQAIEDETLPAVKKALSDVGKNVTEELKRNANEITKNPGAVSNITHSLGDLLKKK